MLPIVQANDVGDEPQRNSAIEEVRRLNSELAQARAVLLDCALTLEGYARYHAERGPEHAHKVVRNAELAARCRAALGTTGAEK
jgi:hypothetical protein